MLNYLICTSALLAPNYNILHSLLFLQNGELTCELRYLHFILHDIENKKFNTLLISTFDQSKTDSKAFAIVTPVGYIITLMKPFAAFLLYIHTTTGTTVLNRIFSDVLT